MAMDLLGWAKRIREAAEKMGEIDRTLHQKIHLENPDILGRAEGVKAINDTFQDERHPIALHGHGGVGKTALADLYARTLHHTRGGNYKGCWRISGESLSAAANDLKPLGPILEVDDNSHSETFFNEMLTALEKDSTVDEPWLLIHDNVDTEDAQKELLGRLSHSHNIHHLITTRLEEWGDRANTIHVDALNDQDAADLLAKCAGEEAPSTAMHDLAVKLLGKHTLALIVVGADLKASGLSAEEYGESYKEVLKSVPKGYDAYKKSVYAAVVESFGRLDENAQAMLRLASFMDPNDIDPLYLEKGAAVLKETVVPFFEMAKRKTIPKRSLEEARNHSLLKPSKYVWREEVEETYKIHRLTQEVLREEMGKEGRQAMLGVASALGAVQFGPRIQHDTDSWPKYWRLSKHCEHLLGFGNLADGETAKLMSKFLNETSVFLRLASGDFERVRQILETKLEVSERAYTRISQSYATTLMNLGEVLDELSLAETDPLAKKDLEDRAETHLTDALEIEKKLDGVSADSIATSHNALASFYWARQRWDEAEIHLVRALEMSIEDGAPPEILGSYHGNLGQLYSNWARARDGANKTSLQTKAMQHKKDGLDLIRQGLGEIDFGTATFLQNLAIEYHISGDAARGLPLQIRAAAIPLAMANKIDVNKHPVARNTISSLAQLLQILGDDRDPRRLAEEDVPNAIKDHEAWQRGETPDWPT